MKRSRVKATHDRVDKQLHHSGGNSGIQGYAVDPAPITMAQGRGRRYKQRFAYLLVDASWELTVLKVELNCVPSVITAVTMAIEIPAAINPYSMAVAPDSSFANRPMSVCIGYSLVVAHRLRKLLTDVFVSIRC